MDRLTHLNGNGDIYFLVDGVRVRIDEIEELRVAEKLKYYEDLEEQGRLVVLPCKVGDTVYVIDWYLDCDIDGFDVCDDYRKNDEIACGYCHHNVVKKFVSERKYENQKIEDFGKTIFLTREEAEAALKSN